MDSKRKNQVKNVGPNRGWSGRVCLGPDGSPLKQWVMVRLHEEMA